MKCTKLIGFNECLPLITNLHIHIRFLTFSHTDFNLRILRCGKKILNSNKRTTHTQTDIKGGLSSVYNQLNSDCKSYVLFFLAVWLSMTSAVSVIWPLWQMILALIRGPSAVMNYWKKICIVRLELLAALLRNLNQILIGHTLQFTDTLGFALRATLDSSRTSSETKLRWTLRYAWDKCSVYMIFSPRISWYFIKSILPSTSCRFAVSEQAKQP